MRHGKKFNHLGRKTAHRKAMLSNMACSLIEHKRITTTVGKAKELTKLILSKPGVEKIAVMMNVVSNTRVDIVARGVVKGCIEAGKDPAETIAIFRIPGAWEDEGFKILEKYGVEYCDRSVSMYDAAGRAVAKMA